jgi:hypothetical protein
MHALIVYESMYGNTRSVAEAIGAGLKGAGASVTIAHAARVTAVQTAAADVVVVGGPTHAWSMTRPSTRRGAVDAARKSPEGNRHIEQDADVRGLREWIADVSGHASVKRFAAFDTRRRVPLGLSGSAARAIDRSLRRLGWPRLQRPTGFYVTKSDELEPDQLTRARAWGAELATAAGP